MSRSPRCPCGARLAGIVCLLCGMERCRECARMQGRFDSAHPTLWRCTSCADFYDGVSAGKGRA